LLVPGSLAVIICAPAVAPGRGLLAFGWDRWDGGQVASGGEMREGVSLTNLDQPLFDGAGENRVRPMDRGAQIVCFCAAAVG
jgi:hypothetical protein